MVVEGAQTVLCLVYVRVLEVVVKDVEGLEFFNFGGACAGGGVDFSDRKLVAAVLYQSQNVN